MKSRRLDVELVERGLAESREQAQRLILAGEVWVEGQRWDKASKVCAASAAIEVRGAERYVSRGGFKLEGALKGFWPMAFIIWAMGCTASGAVSAERQLETMNS